MDLNVGGLTDAYIRNACLKNKNASARQIEQKREEIIKRRSAGIHKGGIVRTRPPGYEDAKYCYYFLEDGECSLGNPIVWKRLRTYVNKVIRFTKWIYKKNFIDPEDVLLFVKEDIGDLNPFEYGAKEGIDAITFLIKKINTQVGREWWKYLKAFNPGYYDKLKMQQKRSKKTFSGKKGENKWSKGIQQKMRDELTEAYLLQQVQSGLKYKTGMKYSFEEIRNTYPHLIAEKRESILRRRALNRKQA